MYKECNAATDIQILLEGGSLYSEIWSHNFRKGLNKKFGVPTASIARAMVWDRMMDENGRLRDKKAKTMIEQSWNGLDAKALLKKYSPLWDKLIAMADKMDDT